jgi:hypothetical protein
MTPDYIYEKMTWAEIDSALEYIFRYDLTELHFKGAVKLKDWIFKGRDMLPDMMRKMVDTLRGKGGA